MLSGFKQMVVAVIVFISGCANDPSLIPPLMVSVTVSLLFNQWINPKGFDEEQILRKNIPFLPPELPAFLEEESGKTPIQAMDLCSYPLGVELPQAARLLPEAPVKTVEEALTCEVDDFPVIVEDRCVGFATRARLEAALASHQQDFQVSYSTPQRYCAEHDGDASGWDRSSWFLNTGPSPAFTPKPSLRYAVSPAMGTPPLSRTMSTQSAYDGMVQVAQLAEKPPHTILHDMPGSRMYSLFAKAGVRVASVVSDNGSFCGMVTRKGLIATLRRPPEQLSCQIREALTSRSQETMLAESDGEAESDGAETVSLLKVARVGPGGL